MKIKIKKMVFISKNQMFTKKNIFVNINAMKIKQAVAFITISCLYAEKMHFLTL